MSYKCTNCGAIKQNDELYYRVRIVRTDGKTIFVPTCNENCAEVIQRKYVELHQSRVEDVKNQCFQVLRWEE